MSNYLNIPLISEAIILDVLCDFENISPKETNESLLLKRLHLILSTVSTFTDAFSEMFFDIFKKYCHKDLSEKEFLNILVPRSLLLCRKKTYFNLMLVCGFMSETVYYFVSYFSCYHFAKLTSKCLSHVIKKEFEDVLKTENGRQGLVSYCDKINRIVAGYSVEEAKTDTLPVKSDYIKKPLSNQSNKYNMNDSEINVEGISQQNNANDVSGHPKMLVGKLNSKQMVIDGSDINELMDARQKNSHLTVFKETEKQHRTQYNESRKGDFLYQLLTDSSEHLDEILSLIDTCSTDIDSNRFSLSEFEVLCSDGKEMSTIVAKIPEKDSSPCLPNSSGDKHFECTSTNISETNVSEFFSVRALDNSQSNSTVNKSNKAFNLLQCCELCRGKEEQFLENWEINFLERYPEFNQDIK